VVAKERPEEKFGGSRIRRLRLDRRVVVMGVGNFWMEHEWNMLGAKPVAE
jgi:hypothetical protein